MPMIVLNTKVKFRLKIRDEVNIGDRKKRLKGLPIAPEKNIRKIQRAMSEAINNRENKRDFGEYNIKGNTATNSISINAIPQRR